MDGDTYNDWYLPSNEEATVMWNSGVVTAFKTGSNWMWTSTGSPPWNAYSLDNSNGAIGAWNRQGGYFMYIIPVRNFE